jgi:hypothetical protein
MEEYDETSGSSFRLSIADVFAGIRKATNLVWYDNSAFNSDEYNFYLRPENGFITWVVPNRLLVMAAMVLEMRLFCLTFFLYFENGKFVQLLILGTKEEVLKI